MSDPTHRAEHKVSTQRLIIRSATLKDAEAIAALRGNPDNNPFEGVDSGDPEVYRKRILNWQTASAEGRYAFLVIVLCPRSSFIELAAAAGHAESTTEDDVDVDVDVDVDGGKLIGFGGYNEFRRVNKPPLLSDDGQQEEEGTIVLEVDIGAQIDHRYRRRGFAREAFVAMVEYAFGELGAAQVACDTDVGNEPWRGLLRAVGLGGKEQTQINPEGHPGCGKPAWLWRFTPGDWALAKEGTYGGFGNSCG